MESKDMINDPKYSFEDILQMLDGNKYYTENQILYCYHNCNGREKEAKYYLDLCLKDLYNLTNEVSTFRKAGGKAE